MFYGRIPDVTLARSNRSSERLQPFVSVMQNLIIAMEKTFSWKGANWHVIP